MKCPMKFGNPCCDVDAECFGRECAWWVQKTHQEYKAEKGRYEVVGIKAEGCAVAFTAAKGDGSWIINNGNMQ